MSSLIEQAAQRLEQLRQAGVVLPDDNHHQQQAAPPRPEAQPAVRVELPPPETEAFHPASKRVELDLTALAAQGFLTPNSPRTHIADQYRVIKRPLIKNAMGK